jgi:hypothetical protein
VKPRRIPANAAQPLRVDAKGAPLAVIGQRSLELERAMGIENTAFNTLTSLNHSVTGAGTRCVRFLCENPCDTGERQRSPANVSLAVAVVEAKPRDLESRAFVRVAYLLAHGSVAPSSIDYIAQQKRLCDVESTPGEGAIRNLTCRPERQHPAESKRELLR